MSPIRPESREHNAERLSMRLLVWVGALMLLAAGWLAEGRQGLVVVFLAGSGGALFASGRTWRSMTPTSSDGAARSDRVAAWLAFKIGRCPSDHLLDYMAVRAATPTLRHEAARLLAKRRARREADLLRAGIGVGGEGQGGGSVD